MDCEFHLHKSQWIPLSGFRILPTNRIPDPTVWILDNGFLTLTGVILSHYPFPVGKPISRVYKKKVIELQCALLYLNYSAYDRDFFIFGKIWLLTVEWYVLHAKWMTNEQIRIR